MRAFQNGSLHRRNKEVTDSILKGTVTVLGGAGDTYQHPDCSFRVLHDFEAEDTRMYPWLLPGQ
jgi:hypothetical protein